MNRAKQWLRQHSLWVLNERGIAATVLSAIGLALTAGGVATGVSAQQTAKKKQASISQQAERIRSGEKVEAKVLAERAEGIEAAAAKSATDKASIRAGRRKRTQVTGPRGLLSEPTIQKPSLLG